MCAVQVTLKTLQICPIPSHLFHRNRGWLIVGKKDMCPQCSEKVDLRRTFANPWETGSLAWAQILDLVRYLVVWQPILLISSQLVLYFMGYH
jgi:RING finger protein 121